MGWGSEETRRWFGAMSRIASRNRLVGVCVATMLACLVVELRATPVPVRFIEGVSHGFLVLRTLEGQAIADGDFVQVVQGQHVNSRITFRFRDGSRHDETAVYTQRREFRLVTYHLVQRGPTFPKPLDMRIDAGTGQVTVRHADDDGEAAVESERLELPADIANGLMSTLLKNVDSAAVPTLSYVAATPKPRIVKLEIEAVAPDRFSTGRRGRAATHFVIKPKLGGVTGLIAPLVGKQPPDAHVWIMQGEAPAFVKAEQSLYTDGPVWRIELASTVWPRGADAGAAAAKKKK